MQSPNFREYRGTISGTETEFREMASAQSSIYAEIRDGSSENVFTSVIAGIGSAVISRLTGLDPTGFSQTLFAALGITGSALSALDSQSRTFMQNSVFYGAEVLESLADTLSIDPLYESLEAEVFFHEYTDPATGTPTTLVHGNSNGGTDRIVISITTTTGEVIYP